MLALKAARVGSRLTRGCVLTLTNQLISKPGVSNRSVRERTVVTTDTSRRQRDSVGPDWRLVGGRYRHLTVNRI